MRQHEVSPFPGATHKKKRVGRGDGSGHGSYAGRGCKGQKARSGGPPRPGFEGGQMPIIKRLPEKRGFFNRFRKQYRAVNIESLNVFPGESIVGPQEMFDAGVIDSVTAPIKVLGDGELGRPVTVRAHGFSASAERKITAAGGKVERI